MYSMYIVHVEMLTIKNNMFAKLTFKLNFGVHFC